MFLNVTKYHQMRAHGASVLEICQRAIDDGHGPAACMYVLREACYLSLKKAKRAYTIASGDEECWNLGFAESCNLEFGENE